jgi:hypothetical protein
VNDASQDSFESHKIKLGASEMLVLCQLEIVISNLVITS